MCMLLKADDQAHNVRVINISAQEQRAHTTHCASGPAPILTCQAPHEAYLPFCSRGPTMQGSVLELRGGVGEAHEGVAQRLHPCQPRNQAGAPAAAACHVSGEHAMPAALSVKIEPKAR